MNKYIITAVVLMSLALLQCKEVETPVVTDPSQLALFDTTYVSATAIAEAPKNVMMEEFSGVKCSNCPKGNLKTNLIANNNLGRAIIVTVHSNFLGSPYPGNPDFRNDDAQELALAPLGPIGGKPSTYINRKIFAGLSGRVVADLNSWESFVSQELALTTPVSLELEKVFADEEERKLRYRIKIEFAQDMSNINLGFALTESHIEAEQLDGSTHIEDYEHEFVLRSFVGSIFGESLSGDLVANTVIIKEFEIDLDDADYNPDADWVFNNMHLVAFVRTSNDEIIQATEIDF